MKKDYLSLSARALVAHCRAEPKLSLLELILAERLAEATDEIDQIIKDFANMLVLRNGPVGAVGVVTDALLANG